MNIGSISSHAFPSIGYAIRASQDAKVSLEGKMSLPVSSGSYIYSHFKHVSGTPAPDGVQGVTISRLKILDTLIEQLARMKKEPPPLLGMDGQDAAKRLDALIEQYQNQIRVAAAAGSAGYTAAAPVSGAIFNLTI